MVRRNTKRSCRTARFAAEISEGGNVQKIEFLSGLGFSEHFAEAIKDMLFESDEFDLAIYNYANGSGQNGNVRALKALNSARDCIVSEAADELESVLENMQPVRRGH